LAVQQKGYEFDDFLMCDNVLEEFTTLKKAVLMKESKDIQNSKLLLSKMAQIEEMELKSEKC
jgi:hypothetical protein